MKIEYKLTDLYIKQIYIYHSKDDKLKQIW